MQANFKLCFEIKFSKTVDFDSTFSQPIFISDSIREKPSRHSLTLSFRDTRHRFRISLHGRNLQIRNQHRFSDCFFKPENLRSTQKANLVTENDRQRSGHKKCPVQNWTGHWILDEFGPKRWIRTQTM